MRALQHVNINFLVLLGKTDSVNSAVKHYQLQMDSYKWLQKMEIYIDKFVYLQSSGGGGGGGDGHWLTGEETNNAILTFERAVGFIPKETGKIRLTRPESPKIDYRPFNDFK